MDICAYVRLSQDLSGFMCICPITLQDQQHKSDIGDKMVDWDNGDICEIHDVPDECDETCDPDGTDWYDESDIDD